MAAAAAASGVAASAITACDAIGASVVATFNVTASGEAASIVNDSAVIAACTVASSRTFGAIDVAGTDGGSFAVAGVGAGGCVETCGGEGNV